MVARARPQRPTPLEANANDLADLIYREVNGMAHTQLRYNPQGATHHETTAVAAIRGDLREGNRNIPLDYDLLQEPHPIAQALVEAIARAADENRFR